MAVIGVHITKITAEKKNSNSVEKIGIENNISVTDVVAKDFSLGSAKQKGLRFVFGFECAYNPDLGSIKLQGDVLYIESVEKIQAIEKEWKDKKSIDRDTMQYVLNAALNKCNIEALKVSQDINLPSPIPLPKVERKEGKPAKAN
jgi:hypothetical protein